VTRLYRGIFGARMVTEPPATSSQLWEGWVHVSLVSQGAGEWIEVVW
jgi:hypothetical protein